MTHPLEKALRPVVRQPESWFGCASELSDLVPELGDRLGEALDAFILNPGRYPFGLMGLARAFYLLAGYAAENYVKGLWLAKHPNDPSEPPVTDAPFLPRELQNHRFSDLAVQATIPLGSGEEATLDFLEEAVTWYARYPVPKKPEGFSLFGIERGQVLGVLALLEKLRKCAGLPDAPPQQPPVTLVRAPTARPRPRPRHRTPHD